MVGLGGTQAVAKKGKVAKAAAAVAAAAEVAGASRQLSGAGLEVG